MAEVGRVEDVAHALPKLIDTGMYHRISGILREIEE